MAKATLDMDLLRTFETGVRLGSFSKAAVAVGRTQSAVSLQMRRLEEQVGVTLFRRDGRNLGLSEAGKMLHRYAQRMLDLNDEALDALARQEVEGEIRVGIPPDLAETWLPRMLARFMRVHPAVAIEARVDRNARLLEDVATGRIDVALAWDVSGSSEPPAGHVATLPMVWIAARSEGASFSGGVLPLVAMNEPCLFRARALAALRAGGIDWRVTFVSSSLAGVWAATAAGLGVTVRTAAALPPDVMRLQQPALPDLGTVRLCVHTADDASRTVRTFAAILVETVREEITKEV